MKIFEDANVRRVPCDDIGPGVAIITMQAKFRLVPGQPVS